MILCRPFYILEFILIIFLQPLFSSHNKYHTNICVCVCVCVCFGLVGSFYFYFRIAYSTVDIQKPKVFAYVAVVKNTELALCHVFSCKSAKQVR